jgi:DNA-binding CsgD family transcriptional regulator
MTTATRTQKNRPKPAGTVVQIDCAPSKLRQSDARPKTQKALSSPEMRVLLYMILGRSTKEIADRLGRSPETIKSHRESIMRKLGASNFGEAIALAYESGVVQPGSHARMLQMEQTKLAQRRGLSKAA